MNRRRKYLGIALTAVSLLVLAASMLVRASRGATLALGGLDPVLLLEAREVGGSVDLERARAAFIYRFASERPRARGQRW